jgi:hypothetical protein
VYARFLGCSPKWDFLDASKKSHFGVVFGGNSQFWLGLGFGLGFWRTFGISFLLILFSGSPMGDQRDAARTHLDELAL